MIIAVKINYVVLKSDDTDDKNLYGIATILHD